MFPAFFGLLAISGPLEILAHRVLWTAILMFVVVLLIRRVRPFLTMGTRAWLLVAAASIFISANWGVYIYGVVSGRVVETALGYFINPLVSVVFGVVFFKERLNRAQLIAVLIAVAAVIVLTIDYGRPPVIALCLAFSFAMYGVVKKVTPLEPRLSVAGEALVAAPIALGFVVFLTMTGASTFVAEGAAHTALLIAAGPVTAIPLLLFAAAVQRVPLVTMGILQYLTPAMQMAWGVLVLHEDMPASRWIGFGLIWAALAVFTVDSLRRARRRVPARVVAVPGS